MTATRGDRTVTALSADDGTFRLEGLDDGAWTIRVEMLGFAAVTREVALPRAADAEPLTLALAMQTYTQIVSASVTSTGPVSPKRPESSEPAAEVDIITGSVVNGATTAFAQPRAFGNNRPARRVLYNFGLTAVGGTRHGTRSRSPSADRLARRRRMATSRSASILPGPLRIPWLVRYGPALQFGYQHPVSHDADDPVSGDAERGRARRRLLGVGRVIRDPLTGLPFPAT